MKTVLLCIIFLVSGFFIGRHLPVGRAEDLPDVAEVSHDVADRVSGTSPEVDSGDVPLINSSDVDAMSAMALNITSSPEAPTGSVVVSTDLIARLSQTGSNRNLGQALIDPDGALEQALQLSEQEQRQLQTSWDATKQRIRELEVNASTVQEMEDLSVKITVPEMTAQMDALSGQFSQSVEQTLGQNRGDVFLAAKQIDQVLGKSSVARTYTIVAESPKEGEWRFNMTLESPAGRRVWVGDSIPEEIRHLTDAAQIFPRISELPE